MSLLYRCVCVCVCASVCECVRGGGGGGGGKSLDRSYLHSFIACECVYSRSRNVQYITLQYTMCVWQDPHDELKGQNVLIVKGSLEKTTGQFSLDVPQTKQLLAECREKLYTARQQRPKPHRDDKILTS